MYCKGSFCKCISCLTLFWVNYYLTTHSRLQIYCAFLLNSNKCLCVQVNGKYFSHSFLNHPVDSHLLHVYSPQTRWMHVQTIINYNQGWMKDFHGSIKNDLLWYMKCFDLLLLFLLKFIYFLWTKNWISGNHFGALVKQFFSVMNHDCVQAGGECLCCCVWKKMRKFFYHLFYFFCLLIQFQELYKVLYENSKSSFNIISFFCYNWCK